MLVNDKNKWLDLLAKAKNGDAGAQSDVGYYYEKGINNDSGDVILEADRAQAMHWYTLSAEQGDESAQLALGTLFSTGDGIERDMTAAIQWTKKALRQGSSAAANNLGTIYRDLKKPSMAFKWYNKAVEMGELDALFQVALCYLFGFGTKKDFNMAYKCLKRIQTEADVPNNLCERTREDALYWLAIFHLVGIGQAKRSVVKARQLLESANKDLDHEQANEILNIIGKSQYILA